MSNVKMFDYGCSFVAKLSLKKNFFFEKKNVFIKYTLFAEKMFLFEKKFYHEKNILLKKTFYIEKRK